MSFRMGRTAGVVAAAGVAEMVAGNGDLVGIGRGSRELRESVRGWEGERRRGETGERSAETGERRAERGEVADFGLGMADFGDRKPETGDRSGGR
jgi:hypothetical protein